MRLMAHNKAASEAKGSGTNSQQESRIFGNILYNKQLQQEKLRPHYCDNWYDCTSF